MTWLLAALLFLLTVLPLAMLVLVRGLFGAAWDTLAQLLEQD